MAPKRRCHKRDAMAERPCLIMTAMTSMRAGGRTSRRSDDARRVRDLLRSELTRGGFSGRRLPAEEQLMADFGVSRSAVRDALTLLRGEHLIDRLQGIGTVDVHYKIVSDLPETHGGRCCVD
jgi:hypothetical protein